MKTLKQGTHRPFQHTETAATVSRMLLDLEKKSVLKFYRDAIGVMKTRPLSNPTSWRYQAANRMNAVARYREQFDDGSAPDSHLRGAVVTHQASEDTQRHDVPGLGFTATIRSNACSTCERASTSDTRASGRPLEFGFLQSVG